MDTDNDDIYRNIFSSKDTMRAIRSINKSYQTLSETKMDLNNHTRYPEPYWNSRAVKTAVNNYNDISRARSDIGNEQPSYDRLLDSIESTGSKLPHLKDEFHLGDSSIYERFGRLNSDNSPGFNFDSFSTSSEPGPSSEQTPGSTSVSSTGSKNSAELLDDQKQLADDIYWPLSSFGHEHESVSSNIKIENRDDIEESPEPSQLLEITRSNALVLSPASLETFFSEESKNPQNNQTFETNRSASLILSSTNLETFLSVSARVNILVRTVRETLEISQFDLSPPPVLYSCIHKITTMLLSRVPEYVTQHCQATWISGIFEHIINKCRPIPLTLDQKNALMSAVVTSDIFNALNNEIKECPVDLNLIHDLIENEISIQVIPFIIDTIPSDGITINREYNGEIIASKRDSTGKKKQVISQSQEISNTSYSDIFQRALCSRQCDPTRLYWQKIDSTNERPSITNEKLHLSYGFGIFTDKGELFMRQNTGQKFYRPIRPLETTASESRKARKIETSQTIKNIASPEEVKDARFTKKDGQKFLDWAIDPQGSDTQPSLFDFGYYSGPDFGSKGITFDKKNFLKPNISKIQQTSWVTNEKLVKSFIDWINSFSLPLVRNNNNKFHRRESKLDEASSSDLSKAVALICTRPARRINRYPAVQYIQDFRGNVNVKNSLQHELLHIPSEAMRQVLCDKVPENIKSIEADLRNTLHYCDDYTKNTQQQAQKHNKSVLAETIVNKKKRRAAVKRLRLFYELQSFYQKRGARRTHQRQPNHEDINLNIKFTGDHGYEPKYIRYDFTLKQAWCSYCPNGGFFFTKNSGYLYHRNHDHGQLPGGGIMEEPLVIRNKIMSPFKQNVDARLCEGLCGICFHWVDVDHVNQDSIKNWGTWFRHYKNCVNEYQDAKRIIELACGDEFELTEFDFKPPYLLSMGKEESQ
ncbi:hypothetical protein NADFUDRAFT_40860 [Nadsonia fulvescens var. elongata DSM 6958]|uniref:Transcription regulator Rua1 C-terminal domain-containing protein n=1 Tax=Nadsonia fulvescens var. elongata DSM 6958 TaxID=857566 RepID=A0A1E3PMP7_9ASCO|nr:hypothetical protein NADFUDRAFT_40860 [Nadsonia fulvescens var. elongata DSM 6958]